MKKPKIPGVNVRPSIERIADFIPESEKKLYQFALVIDYWLVFGAICALVGIALIIGGLPLMVWK